MAGGGGASFYGKIPILISYLKPSEKFGIFASMIANIFPVFGFVFLQWDYKAIIICYWFETVINEFYSAIKLLAKSFSYGLENRAVLLFKIMTAPIMFMLFFGIPLLFSISLLPLMSNLFGGAGFIDVSLISSGIYSAFFFCMILFADNTLRFIISIRNKDYLDVIFPIQDFMIRFITLFLAIWLGAAVFTQISALAAGIIIVVFKSISDFSIMLFLKSKRIEKEYFKRLRDNEAGGCHDYKSLEPPPEFRVDEIYVPMFLIMLLISLGVVSMSKAAFLPS